MTKKVMTKEEFAKRWDSDEEGGGITYDDIAECAISWGVSARPRTQNMKKIVERVVKASGAKDGY